MLKKGDIFIIITVLALAIASSALLFFGKGEGRTVIVKENNGVVYKGSLYENKVIELRSNTVEIKDGTVTVTKADCKNQICVNHAAITKRGESIICLPNGVIAEIE
ncbi:MAG: NusG domain II-containing protein [Acutalibacteraceae bacterium]